MALTDRNFYSMLPEDGTGSYYGPTVFFTGDYGGGSSLFETPTFSYPTIINPQPTFSYGDLTGDLEQVNRGGGIFDLGRYILPNIPGIDLRDEIGEDYSGPTITTPAVVDTTTGETAFVIPQAPITNYIVDNTTGTYIPVDTVGPTGTPITNYVVDSYVPGTGGETDLGGYNDLYTPPVINYVTPDRIADVSDVYRQYLGRDPEPGAAEWWASTGASINDIVSAIAGSQEGQNYATQQQQLQNQVISDQPKAFVTSGGTTDVPGAFGETIPSTITGNLPYGSAIGQNVDGTYTVSTETGSYQLDENGDVITPVQDYIIGINGDTGEPTVGGLLGTGTSNADSSTTAVFGTGSTPQPGEIVSEYGLIGTGQGQPTIITDTSLITPEELASYVVNTGPTVITGGNQPVVTDTSVYTPPITSGLSTVVSDFVPSTDIALTTPSNNLGANTSLFDTSIVDTANIANTGNQIINEVIANNQPIIDAIVANTGQQGNNLIIDTSVPANTAGSNLSLFDSNVIDTTGQTVTNANVIVADTGTANANVIGNVPIDNANVITIDTGGAGNANIGGNVPGSNANIITIDTGANANANISANVPGNANIITIDTGANANANANVLPIVPNANIITIDTNTLGNLSNVANVANVSNVANVANVSNVANVDSNVIVGNIVSNVITSTDVSNVESNVSNISNIANIANVSNVANVVGSTTGPYQSLTGNLTINTGAGYLQPGLIAPTPFYQTTSPVQSQYSWGTRMLQPGPTFNPKFYNTMPNAPATPFGIQNIRTSSLTPEELADIFAGRTPKQQTFTQATPINPNYRTVPTQLQAVQPTGQPYQLLPVLPIRPIANNLGNIGNANPNAYVTNTQAYDDYMALIQQGGM